MSIAFKGLYRFAPKILALNAYKLWSKSQFQAIANFYMLKIEVTLFIHVLLYEELFSFRKTHNIKA